MGIFSFIKNLFDDDDNDDIDLNIDDTYLIETSKNNDDTWEHVCQAIEEILDEYDDIKIGKTGNPSNRVLDPKYQQKYEIMFLIVASKKSKLISDLERESIRAYYDELDNISTLSGGKMRTPDGYYYLYIVVY